MAFDVNPHDEEPIDREEWKRFQCDSKLAEEIAKHWLIEMRCDHDAKTDTAFCACGWRGIPMRSVGQAAEEWARHVVVTALTARTSRPAKPKPNWLHDADEKAGFDTAEKI